MKISACVLAATGAMGLLAGCAHAPPGAALDRAVAAAVAPDGAVELRQPRAGVYTAGQPAQGDWKAIAARGVTTVVNLRTPKEMEGRDEAAEVAAAGMRYVAIPVAGADGIDAANATLLHDVLRAANGPVLLHCHSGNRAGGLLALMAAQEDGMPAEQALALGRAAGMIGTEPRVRELLQVPGCAVNRASGQPERCP